jgi:HAD superfamily hydrolase (TIGR01509 family)
MGPSVAADISQAWQAGPGIVVGPPRHEPAALHGLRGLLFDLGDVIYDATIWRRWLANLLGHLGVTEGYRELFALWDSAFLEDVHRGLREYDEAFRSFLLELGLSLGQVDEVAGASAAKRRELGASLRPLPGVRTTVDRLHADGHTLGVLSDSEDAAPALQQRLKMLGMDGRFAAVVSSVSLGRTKPDPRCYQAALAEMKLEAPHVAFVGHDAAELRGATAVGMRTIAVNHEPGAEADVYLERFEDLPNYAAPFRCAARESQEGVR